MASRPTTITAALLALSAAAVALLPLRPASAADVGDLRQRFASPPDTARPWVYWYFMDGNLTREGIHADLEAMKKAGIGGAIFLDVDIGIPRGPVAFMSPEWQDLFAYAVSEAKRLGLQIALGSGPGWNGTGGPWVTPERSMQHLVGSRTTVSGPAHFDAVLPRPEPRTPFFGEGTLQGDLHRKWQDFYRDTAVVAFPTPAGDARVADTDHKALYYRAPYSSQAGTPPRIPDPADFGSIPAGECVPAEKIVDLTGRLTADGRLTWDVPAGNWTILRFGRTATGATTRPAPAAGLGFESDKFDRAALAAHLDAYTEPLFRKLGPDYRSGDSGLTMLHFDSWEMSAQNWSPAFRREFVRRRGYDPLPYLPAMLGYVVGSPERSERFLWDLRQTASDLIVDEHARPLAEYAHRHGLTLAIEPYDMNPSADLDLGAPADLPMGEFWAKGYGYSTEFSVREAVSVGHTNGRRVIGAESFTAQGGEDWHLYPGALKAQLDWALCAGINKFAIHRYQHQPDLGKFPGMTMGPYGVHWERTETWWDMALPFHRYMARCSEMLREGLPVADVLYLNPEGAPQVFTPPASALTDGLPDQKGYRFDGCSPENLIAYASVKNGRIVFPDGMSYRLLVLPDVPAMTPALLRAVTRLVRAGATVVGAPPRRSPSLTGYPACDAEVQTLAAALWGKAPYAAERRVGKGRVAFAAAERTATLDHARWIWSAEGDPARSAPVGTRYFHKSFTLDAHRRIAAAVCAVTADNAFTLFVNGHRVGSGDDFHHVARFDIAPWLKPGSNAIRVAVENEGDSPNPAGLIGSFVVSFADGGSRRIDTGADWSAAAAPEGLESSARDLGPSGMGPWSLGPMVAAPYPEYAVTADLLQRLGTPPDFSASAAASLRYIHRHLADGDLYFVANATGQPIRTVCTFRTAGRAPEWWDPLTGETRPLPDFQIDGPLTRLPVRLGPYESGFVVFRKPAAGADSRIGGVNFPAYRTVTTLAGPWSVAFDPRWGGPANVAFDRLDDWSRRPEPGIEYYSGKAVYTKVFDLPPSALKQGPRLALALGVVKNLASVRLNGRDLGTVWCDPWRVEIPAGVLKPTGNRLEVTVANLWVNRLIGDSGKPQAERLTDTTGNRYRPDSPLEPSGLLGPVTVETVDR